MKSYTKALAGGALLTVLLCVCATTSIANRLAFRNEYSTNRWRATWSRLELTGTFGTIDCTLTLEGSFHSNTVTKTASSLIGYVTAASTSACAPGSATVLRENLPWHLQYSSFAGTLPNISSVALRIIGFEFRYTQGGVGCLSRSTAERPLIATLTREASGVVTSVALSGTLRAELCGEWTFSGRSTSFGTPPPPPSPSTAITLSLI
jgi:hypothetical protein